MSLRQRLRERKQRALTLLVVIAVSGLVFTTVATSAKVGPGKAASRPFAKAAEGVAASVDSPGQVAPKAATTTDDEKSYDGEEDEVAEPAHGSPTTIVPLPSTQPKSPTAPSTPTTPSPLPEVTGPVFVVPASIDATGSADVTADLLAFIASVPDGSVISFPAGATYRAEGSLRIENRNNLVFEGNGATIVADSTADRGRRHWWFVGGSNITVRNMTVRGANPHAGTGGAAYVADLEAQHGFDIQGVVGFLLDRVAVTDVYGDFVYLGRGAGRWSQKVVVQDSYFERNGRQGVAITAADDVLITRNYIGQTRRATFDIEPNGEGWGATNIRIVENEIGPGRLLFLASVGSSAGVVKDVLIERNNLVGRAMNMQVRGASLPADARRSNFRVLGNTSDFTWGNAGGALMNFSGIDGVEVRDNVQPLQANRGNAGVSTIETCSASVNGNQFPNAVEEHRRDDWPC